LSNEERALQIRQHNVAVNFAIKSLLQELETLKISEGEDPHAAGVLQAQTMSESVAIVESKLQQQAQTENEEARRRNMSRRELMAKYRPSRPMQMSPQQLASYDINKVKRLQGYLKNFLMHARFKNLGSWRPLSLPCQLLNSYQSSRFKDIIYFASPAPSRQALV
jgi:hypothetical protein